VTPAKSILACNNGRRVTLNTFPMRTEVDCFRIIQKINRFFAIRFAETSIWTVTLYQSAARHINVMRRPPRLVKSIQLTILCVCVVYMIWSVMLRREFRKSTAERYSSEERHQIRLREVSCNFS
jgi:hypothetical protein